MSLQQISGSSLDAGFISRSLNTPMTRREFLGMGAALLLSLFGVQNFLNVVAKHTKTTSPVIQMTGSENGFGARKFGQ